MSIIPRELKRFGHPEYSMDEAGPEIAVSGPHKAFFNSAVGI